jgi:hypothetical protein
LFNFDESSISTVMLNAPEKYLEQLITAAKIDKDISSLIQFYIQRCRKNLHFIIDEKELEFATILGKLCIDCLPINNVFNFKIGQKVISLKHQNNVYKVIALQPDITLTDCKSTLTTKSLNCYIPLSNSNIAQIGTIRNRIADFKEYFGAEAQSDFFCNEKLLVIGNRNLFLTIPKECPSCYASENEDGNIEIEYNSPLLPKICVLKNINLLDSYFQKEINGSQIKFDICIFIGCQKFEHSISTIRNYYNQGKFTKAVFIGEKDNKLDLGNNQLPLRWKWTIPEIKYFTNTSNLQHKNIIIQNTELEQAITAFYQTVREIENKHTIGLKSIFRFIRRIYYDWNLKQDSTLTKLHQIQLEFDIALKQLLIETLGNIFPDFDFDEYQKPLSTKFIEILNTVKNNNKTEKLKTYQSKIHQLILPSYLCNSNKNELNQIFKQIHEKTRAQGLQDIGVLLTMSEQSNSDPNRSYYALTGNQTKTEIVSFAKSDDANKEKQKVISSIYGSGKIEKLIERLGRAKTEYKLLLYGIEEKAFNFHIEKYVEDLNHEYNSTDRFEICGVTFSDNFYQFSNFDELIEALASTKHDQRITDSYKIVFNDKMKVKLPSSKSVLKVVGNEKKIVLVEDLSVGDQVIIYANPDRDILRAIIELKHSKLIEIADKYSSLWRTCLNDAFQNNIMSEPLYEQLVKNHFSVSEHTFRKYIDGEIMFPRSFSDLIIIAKTINDTRLSFDFLKNTMKPKIEEYRGKEIEYGFKFSNCINHFILTGERDEFIAEWLTQEEVEKVVASIPTKTIKDIELISTQNNNDE